MYPLLALALRGKLLRRRYAESRELHPLDAPSSQPDMPDYDRGGAPCPLNSGGPYRPVSGHTSRRWWRSAPGSRATYLTAREIRFLSLFAAVPTADGISRPSRHSFRAAPSSPSTTRCIGSTARSAWSARACSCRIGSGPRAWEDTMARRLRLRPLTRGAATRVTSATAPPSDFSIVCNPVRYGSTVIESLRSLLPLAEASVVGVGRSENQTLDVLLSGDLSRRLSP